MDTKVPPVHRVALVTGAARGIGRATVDILYGQGYSVVAVDSCAGEGPNRPAGVEYPLATPEELSSLELAYPGRVVTSMTDVRDVEAMGRAALLAVDRFGHLDAAVACAAVITGGQPQWGTPQAHFQTLLDVDVVGVWNTAAATVPMMLNGPNPQGCRFVAVASAAGTRGLFHLAGYSAAKHAVVGLVRGLAADLVGTGVTAVAVSPGSTDTAMLKATASLYGLADIEEFASSQLVRRLLRPHEVAATIAFCCSPDGAALNGSVVEATGGFTA